MALFRAALLAASLGPGAVFALPQESPSSSPDHFSVFKAHTESKKPTLLIPSTTSSAGTAKVNAPSIETPESHLSVAPDTPTADVHVPYTETTQHTLDVPTTEAPTQGNIPDLKTRSTADVGAVPGTLDQHQVTGGGDPPYTPSGETTLYAAGTPVVTGPAGTAIIIHGTPVMAGLPAAVVDGTTYALEAGGSSIWVNGRPEPLASPTPWSPDNTPDYPEPTQATWHTVHGTDWPGAQTETTHAHPEATTKIAKPTTKSPVEKPSDKPSSPSTSMTWIGPGLTTETGIGDAANVAVNLIPGLTLAILCFLLTLI